MKDVNNVLQIMSEQNDDFILHYAITSDNTYSILIMEKHGIAFARIYWYGDDNINVYLDYLSVNIKNRKNTIGTRLQKLQERIAKEIGFLCAILLVEKETWMHDWYTRRGYRDSVSHDTRNEYVWMTKKLIDND